MPPNVVLNPALVRLQMPDLVLREGASLVARVAERNGRVGLLMLAGAPLTAELPEQVQPGDRLRLRVEQVTAQRIVMRLVQEPAGEASRPGQPQPAGAAQRGDAPAAGVQHGLDAQPVVPLPLPGGQRALIQAEEREGEGRRERGEGAVRISFQSQALGAIDFRLALEGGAVTARVEMREGAPAEQGRAALSELASSLERSLWRPAQVALAGRDDSVDLHA